jgi:hypothetical protein
MDLLENVEVSVSAAGHEWIDTFDGPVLIERRSCDRRKYRPFSKENAALFLRFAELEPTQPAILKFANEYGLLGGPLTHSVEDKRLSVVKAFLPNGEPAILRGELFDGELVSQQSQELFARFRLRHFGWVDHIIAMAGLQRSLRKLADGESLWDESRHTLSLGMSRRLPTVVSPKTGLPAGPKKLSPVNRERMKLAERPMIAGAISQMLDDLVITRFEYVMRSESYRLAFEPNSLIGSLWLQAAMALSHRKDYRRCLRNGCSRLLEISRDTRSGKRSHALFCSNACRSRDSRERKRRARELASQQIADVDIARSVRSDVETVRSWVARTRRAPRHV